ncbi:MAG: hypothetical protein E2O39_08410 [Planctomycetota bacterium]|nr:MAG: hypothetical protein E2O39_08410 [Planctomycetota bacterium]
MSQAAHSRQASYREALLEHLFVGAVLRALWLAGPVHAEVLKPQVDDAGYDIVVESKGILRHIQLKSSFLGAKTASQKIHRRLAEKPGGCVVWIMFDPETLDLGPFLWFGSPPGEPLPDLRSFKIARHTKGDATGHKALRPMIRVVPKGRFTRLDTIEDVVGVLFGR